MTSTYYNILLMSCILTYKVSKKSTGTSSFNFQMVRRLVKVFLSSNVHEVISLIVFFFGKIHLDSYNMLNVHNRKLKLSDCLYH